MDNGEKLIPEMIKGLLYMIFIYPFVWVWEKITGGKK